MTAWEERAQREDPVRARLPAPPRSSPPNMTTPQATSPLASTTPSPSADAPRTQAEAAEQFEAVLVRQFVQAMTKDLFKQSLSGEGMSSGHVDTQRDVLTDALTDHLVGSGALSLSDLLLRQWSPGDDTHAG